MLLCGLYCYAVMVVALVVLYVLFVVGVVVDCCAGELLWLIMVLMCGVV